MLSVFLIILLIVIYIRIKDDNEQIDRRLAEIERIIKISDKEEQSKIIKESLRKLKETGVNLGPPVKLTEDVKLEILKMRSHGLSIRMISEQLGLSSGSIHKVIKYRGVSNV